MLTIREAERADLRELLELYTQLHDNNLPEMCGELISLWEGILANKDYHILLGLVGGQIVSTCTMMIIPNLTHGQRPYALVENVLTHREFRKRGYATQVLDAARDMARQERCYKIMLLTGSKEESTLKFYESAGYNRTDKTGFIQWLD